MRSMELYDVEGCELLHKYGTRVLCRRGRWTGILGCALPVA